MRHNSRDPQPYPPLYDGAVFFNHQRKEKRHAWKFALGGLALLALDVALFFDILNTASAFDLFTIWWLSSAATGLVFESIRRALK
jgi:hypothetical protein